jgi:hypothetical protein
MASILIFRVAVPWDLADLRDSVQPQQFRASDLFGPGFWGRKYRLPPSPQFCGGREEFIRILEAMFG